MELEAHDVHVWQVDLDDPGWDSLFGVLSRDEREKARHYRTRELQDHYRRCRSALRMLLAKYARVAGEHLVFQYNRFGKPALADHPWHFNLSHSGDRALIAISRHPVGVDLEALGKAGIDIDELSEWVCHPHERIALECLPSAERRMRFYRLWTQKEAYCKALGVGLQRTLSFLRLEILPHGSVFRVIDGEANSDAHSEADRASSFFVHDLPMSSGYAASLCVPFANPRIQQFVHTNRNLLLRV